MTAEAFARAPSVLRRLQEAVRPWLPLSPLSPVEYAAGHALFESRSDQREHIVSWLIDHVAARADGPTRVLSIGCGDGSVDVQVAAALASHGQRVDYVCVEPHTPSGRACASRMAEISGVDETILNEPFERTRPSGPFDVVLAVHSLYYVNDLADTLGRAATMLAPGGELIVLHAPLEPLNVLVRLLAPGPRQAFGDEVTAHLRALGRAPRMVRVDSRLDLTTTGDAETDRQLIAFTIQANLPSELLGVVRDALAERALPEAGLVLTHPVDALVVRA